MALPIPQLPNIAAPAKGAASAPGLNGGANKFASGNKNYGAGQVGAATGGTLSKVGYLTRERKKKLRQLAMLNAAKANGSADTLGSAL